MADAAVKTYVLNTMAGEENRLLLYLQSGILRPDEHAYLPLIQLERRIEGVWKLHTRPLFPGYVFVQTPYPEHFFMRIKFHGTDQFIRLLLWDGTLAALSQEEENWLMELCGEDHVARPSVGTMENGKVKILSGPLKHFTNQIVYINKHKKKAAIRLQFLGLERVIRVSLEIIEKKD